jgi:hypothetical protein
MAKPLVFQLNGNAITFGLSKVDRSELYGYVEIETLDEKGRKCVSGALASDGQTLIGSGGSAFACLSQDGRWLERAKLAPVDAEGKKLTPVPSSFNAPIELTRTATIDEYLGHSIRSVYQLNADGDVAPLMTELSKGTIFTFPYSYRGGLQPDTGFLLLASDGNAFLAIGTPTRMEFVSWQQSTASVVDEETATEDEGDDIDFGSML